MMYFVLSGYEAPQKWQSKTGIKALSEQALKAANQLHVLSLCKQMSFDIKTKLKLFESLISRILLCAAEVWGIYEYEHKSKIHIKFYKTILVVRT